VDLPSGIYGSDRRPSWARRSRASQNRDVLSGASPGTAAALGRLHCGPTQRGQYRGSPAEVLAEDCAPRTFVNDASALSAFRSPRTRPPINMTAALPWWSRAALPRTGRARLAARGALRAGQVWARHDCLRRGPIVALMVPTP
jgi:hypothetical protein